MSTQTCYLFMQNYIKSFKNVATLLLSIILMLLQLHSFAQGKEANIWYFGQYAGIDFNEGSPPATLLNSQMSAGGGGPVVVPVLLTAVATCYFIPMG